ncbi:type III-B CRISPR module RAMP protein Cmr4 [Candidatus Nitrotoga sp. M5]|uniref:type III-B CRISPR module RAMP protein Cmr4 n=1 Tax=Candidatus Nitrotoga sp. M5 TaxID=2890409 RepID=UPI001EF707BC|nr:type III-B CRISPR module RAMP protein Cmr4 [Candidatus Nitrotoga sp. M5]CAH1388340.1 CRISPR-associated RAMP protein, Cmr4 family [Candidatus Nitrotoga sp. M5]
MNNQATALLGLLTETSLHAGASSSVDGVDMPIQRESHNGWPCVYGSAVKGALRDNGESNLSDKNDALAIFGPETSNASDNAGAVAIGDARLLLLPVRSLTSAFKWVTCAEALNRLKRDAKRMGLENDFGFVVLSAPDDESALALDKNGDLFLEEYRFKLTKEAKVEGCITSIAKLMRRDDAETELKKRLIIISDDMFTHLTQAAVPINAHIALNSDTKTTQGGALWYEETLPPETLLYVPLAANTSRKASHKLEASEVMDKVTNLFADKPYLQLGGNETVGMGWCAVEVLKGA